MLINSALVLSYAELLQGQKRNRQDVDKICTTEQRQNEARRRTTMSFGFLDGKSGGRYGGSWAEPRANATLLWQRKNCQCCPRFPVCEPGCIDILVNLDVCAIGRTSRGKEWQFQNHNHHNVVLSVSKTIVSELPTFHLLIIHGFPKIALLTEDYLFLTHYWKGERKSVPRTKTTPSKQRAHYCRTTLWNDLHPSSCPRNSSFQASCPFSSNEGLRRFPINRRFYCSEGISDYSWYSRLCLELSRSKYLQSGSISVFQNRT